VTTRRTSLATRTTALCLLVAAVALAVAGLVGTRLLAAATEDLTRESLARKADAIAGTLTEQAFTRPFLTMPKTITTLRAEAISIVARKKDGTYYLADARPERAARAAGLDRILPGRPIHTTVTLGGEELLVEARAVTDRVGFALVRPVRLAEDTSPTLLRDVLLAVGVGLAVAAVAGMVLARLLSRPLRQTAAVAGSLRSGRRDVRAPVSGPTEVAEVAESVNELADALTHSEARQRDFLLSVSHELRTPLTSVKGFAESLAEGVVQGDDVPGVGRTIQQEAERLERLVNDLLALARLGADEFSLDVTEVDLVRLLNGCAEVWPVWCQERGVRFRHEVPDGPVPVRADPRRLRQALEVLANNALRVTPPEAPLVLALVVRPDAAIVQVRDGGPGLSEEDYRVAFDRGVLRSRYRGERPVGSGIGLALAHGLVSRMDGAMSAGPAPEGGAAFSITLPLFAPAGDLYRART
jgi:two-component system OmpR family sensor kinase